VPIAEERRREEPEHGAACRRRASQKVPRDGPAEAHARESEEGGGDSKRKKGRGMFGQEEKRWESVEKAVAAAAQKPFLPEEPAGRGGSSRRALDHLVLEVEKDGAFPRLKKLRRFVESVEEKTGGREEGREESQEASPSRQPRRVPVRSGSGNERGAGHGEKNEPGDDETGRQAARSGEEPGRSEETGGRRSPEPRRPKPPERSSRENANAGDGEGGEAEEIAVTRKRALGSTMTGSQAIVP